MKSAVPASRVLASLTALLAGLSMTVGGAHAQSGSRTDQAVASQIEMLEAADANGDGVLTTAEFSSTLKDTFSRMDRSGDGSVNAKDAPGFARRQYMSRVGPVIEERDVNGDGSLTYAEFTDRPLKAFGFIDEDGDGKVLVSAFVASVTQSAGAGGG